MRVTVSSAKPYDEEFLEAANGRDGRHDLTFLDVRLDVRTAGLADGSDAVCAFVNDDLSGPVLERLAKGGVRLVALRSAGFNHVDVPAAERCGLVVARVPAYSPNAVAEHTLALILALNRKIYRAYSRVREGNFSLVGLLGFDLARRTVGVIGTGAIGRVVVRILRGFGCDVLAYDPFPDTAVTALGARYVDFEALLRGSDIVTLHCPLTPATHHLIDARAISRMRDGVMLINTSRGALVDTGALVEALKAGHVGAVGLDVYEEEGPLFFEDRSAGVISDDVFARLLTFPNVVVTGHQGFFTADALEEIASTTIANLDAFEETGSVPRERSVTSEMAAPALAGSPALGRPFQ